MNILMNDERKPLEHNDRILENRYSEIYGYCIVEYKMNKHFQVNKIMVVSQINQTSQEAMLMIFDKTRASESQVSVKRHYLKRMQTLLLQC